jgi:hypothetical protein
LRRGDLRRGEVRTVSGDAHVTPAPGEFVGCADYDLIAFAALWVNMVWGAAFYHAQQAIEKYLKTHRLVT